MDDLGQKEKERECTLRITQRGSKGDIGFQGCLHEFAFDFPGRHKKVGGKPPERHAGPQCACEADSISSLFSQSPEVLTHYSLSESQKTAG